MFPYSTRPLFLIFCLTACATPVAKDAFFTPSPNPSPSTPVSRPLATPSNPSTQLQATPEPLASPTAGPPALRIQQNLPETDDNGKISDIQVTFSTSDNQVKILKSITLSELASGFPISAQGLTAGIAYETSISITRLKASCTHITVFKGAGKWTPAKEAQTMTLAFPDKTLNQACENSADATASSTGQSPAASTAFNAENDAVIRKKMEDLFLSINQQSNEGILKHIQVGTPFYINNLYYGPYYFAYFNSMEYKDLEIKHYATEIQAVFKRVVNAPYISNRSLTALYESTVILKFKQVDKTWYLVSASQNKNGSLNTMRSPAAFTGGTSTFETVTPLSN
ncbi:MAG: hypothetical protein AB7I41_09700 [Candidatus Sericytochromatia bacterium]